MTQSPSPVPGHTTTELTEDSARELYKLLFDHDDIKSIRVVVRGYGNCTQFDLVPQNEHAQPICEFFRRLFFREYALALVEEKGPVLFLAFLTIKPEYRRRGIGRLVYTSDSRAAERIRAREIRMTATEDNLTLFRKWGFRPIDLLELGREFRKWKRMNIEYAQLEDHDFLRWPEAFVRQLSYIDAVKAVA